MNRYAPPSAVVQDIAEVATRKRPAQVVFAVWLLWASSLLSISEILLEERRMPSVGSVVAALISIAISAFLYPRIHRGANWARLVVFVLVVLNTGALAFTASLVKLPWGFHWIGDFLAAACDVIAMCLLFARPGSTWFRRVERL